MQVFQSGKEIVALERQGAMAVAENLCWIFLTLIYLLLFTY